MGKQLQLEADGEKYAVTIKTGLDQMLDTMGFNNVSTRQAKDIKAPMPGLVLDISVKEGDEVQEGQRVLILEAMKMENSIVMHSHGVIKKVLVQKGQAVDKNQVLVELE
jgi:biotin carboxyl carrier protein